MPAALDVDREQVRMLVLSLGVREAARQMGLAQGTVQDWSATGKWLQPTRPIPASLPPPANVGRPTNPTKPADLLCNQLAEDDRETKLGLSRLIRRSVDRADSVPLETAQDALSAGKLASLIHGWAGDRASLAVNIYQDGARIADARVIDGEELTE